MSQQLTSTTKIYLIYAWALIGLLTLLNALAFFMPDFGSSDPFDGGSYFLIGFIPLMAFCVIVLFSRISHRRKKAYFPSRRLHYLILTAFSMSAYLLNYDLRLFAPLAEWMRPVIITLHVLLLLYAYQYRLPAWLQIVMGVLAGGLFWISLAMTTHILPAMGLSIIVFWFFGLSLHSFVPVMICVALLVPLFRDDAHSKWRRLAFGIGSIAPMAVLLFFFSSWHDANRIIHEASATQITERDNPLPAWVRISQRWEESWVFDRVMIGTKSFDEANRDIGLGGSSFINGRTYDPLISLVMMTEEQVNLSSADRKRIIMSQFDGRHHSERRLWSDRDLETTEVLTEVDLHPTHGYAYVEKTLTIKNTHRRNINRPQEAVYSFHMPEGAVATSLSLWIEGVEEKSRLTTKAKADSAYVTIVGRERRDPALMHWQEGNRITVTVFPCTPEEDRRFKIGLTVPLTLTEQGQALDNIYFEGPDASAAYETIVVNMPEGHASGTDGLPSGFSALGKGRYSRTDDYEPKWSIDLDGVKLSETSFVHKGMAYTPQPTPLTEITMEQRPVYLDINAEWTDSEIERALEITDPERTFIFSNGMIPTDDPEIDQQIERLSGLRFSLFPFFLLPDDEAAVVITKSCLASPNIKDIKNSGFGNSLRAYLAREKQDIMVVDLADKHAPYLQTLAQFDRLEMVKGGLDAMEKWRDTELIALPQLPAGAVAIGSTGYHIRQDSTELTSGPAPDHLMRLFAYNKILAEIGPTYFSADDYNEGHLITMAKEAHVVTPISSMIVLETIKDYDRFGIDKNESSLQNASMGSSGAVPEPHEWVLICFALCLPLYYLFKR